MNRKLAAALALLIAFAAAGSPRAEELVSLSARPGVTQSFYFTKPAAAPTAALVLFAGGDGKLRNYGPPNLGRGNFLVRSRGLFLEHGFAVAVMDAPSDQSSGMPGFRLPA